jgi:hypothetical protein
MDPWTVAVRFFLPWLLARSCARVVGQRVRSYYDLAELTSVCLSSRTYATPQMRRTRPTVRGQADVETSRALSEISKYLDLQLGGAVSI